MQGKTAVPVNELHAGDIGAVAKLKDTLTGDTLGDKGAPIQYPQVTFAEPAITFAIEPKTRADEDKLSNGIHKLMEEDAMLRFFRDPQTKEFLIAGTGQQHIEVVVSKLKNRYHTEVSPQGAQGPLPRDHSRHAPTCRAATRSRPAATASSAIARSRWSPCRAAATSSSSTKSSAAPFPRTTFPPSKRASSKPPQRGFLAGFPVVDFRVILYDGSYHDVDSNELSFKTAGRIAFRKAMEQAKPTLLEPIMNVEITIPDEFAGAIMGDLNSRRGRIQGMDNKAGKTVVKAEVPMAEMLTYGTDLTSMTQGRGSFSMEMDHYDFVPALQQEKIIAAAKAERGEEVEEEE